MSQPLSAPLSHATPLYLNEPARAFLSLVGSGTQFLRDIKPPTTSNITFEWNGILFKAKHQQQSNNTAHLTIWGELGYLPYTVSSRQNRQSLITILEGTHALPHVKFGVDAQMRIWATGEYKISNPLAPDYLFVPFIRFLEESVPFMRLIGEYL